MIQENIYSKVVRLLLAAVLVFPLAAGAAIVNLSATIDGGQEVPAVTSLGSGAASMTFDDISNLLSWNITFNGLSGPATAAHFHGAAPAGSNAGVLLNIGNISGLLDPMVGSATITAPQATDLLAGLWYINIHTALNPGGEIRGQVQVVPLPAAIWLFGFGIVSLIGVSSRRHLA
ncbi:MAG: CHRD domain-containing protein [Gammaproteobacteria bacterium]